MINPDKKKFIQICSESQTMAEAARKLGLHFNTFKRYAVKFGCYKSNQSGRGLSKKRGEKHKFSTEDILNGKHPDYQTFKLKNRLFSEGYKEEKCEFCGITDWNGLPLVFEMNHKDGCRFNHSLDNLEILCPNCHSQTPTWRARNKK